MRKLLILLLLIFSSCISWNKPRDKADWPAYCDMCGDNFACCVHMMRHK